MSAPKKCGCGSSIAYQYNEGEFYEGSCTDCCMRWANPKPKPQSDRIERYRDKAEIDLAIEHGKIACKNADYFHNHPTYDFNKK